MRKILAILAVFGAMPSASAAATKLYYYDWNSRTTKGSLTFETTAKANGTCVAGTEVKVDPAGREALFTCKEKAGKPARPLLLRLGKNGWFQMTCLTYEKDKTTLCTPSPSPMFVFDEKPTGSVDLTRAEEEDLVKGAPVFAAALKVPKVNASVPDRYKHEFGIGLPPEPDKLTTTVVGLAIYNFGKDDFEGGKIHPGTVMAFRIDPGQEEIYSVNFKDSRLDSVVDDSGHDLIQEGGGVTAAKCFDNHVFLKAKHGRNILVECFVKPTPSPGSKELKIKGTIVATVKSKEVKHHAFPAVKITYGKSYGNGVHRFDTESIHVEKDDQKGTKAMVELVAKDFVIDAARVTVDGKTYNAEIENGVFHDKLTVPFDITAKPVDIVFDSHPREERTLEIQTKATLGVGMPPLAH